MNALTCLSTRIGCVLTLCLGAFSAHAGAWKQKPGAGAAVANVSYLPAESYSDDRGKKHDFSLQEIALTLYGSYGVFPKLAVGGSITPHKLLLTSGKSATGITDLDGWIDHHLGSLAAWQFALRYGATLPIGLENPSWLPADFYAVHSQGVFGVSLLPLVGFSHGSFWLQGMAGVKWRDRDLVAQGRFQIDGGSTVAGSRLSLRLGLGGLMPLDQTSNGLPSDQEQYFGVQMAGEMKLPRNLRAGLQFDSMFTHGQDMPVGLRSNIYLGWSWI